ncbi:hypothetical protein C8J56DRAFT_185991 [Mycena floridula]|nr:hypothetical protein C8J56DRAFT_185991 [Mycena floridula]
MDPLPIRRLHESLVNRIAAGEIIHRPASALKELLENCLDAGSTSIRVTVKDGGLKMLQIQDNGCGIRKADLPILAERFTTSKISAFSDLSSLKTYGFRGEALASISHVAQLTVITKTKEESCAWKACYSDGVMVPGQQGQTADPKPCAGNDGTTIIIENLFYNTPTRLSALRSASDEFARILDVMTKYAVHNASVAFMCKKSSSPSPSLATPSASSTSQAIRVLYGHSIAKELIQTKVSSGGRKSKSKENSEGEDESEEVEDTEGGWFADVHFTSANYQAKKMVFLLFINHRLVDSQRLKRALEGVYTAVLPKGSSPFVYLSLVLPPNTVDVNVHPTKSAVHFLDEDAIIERIADEVQRVLAEKSSKSRGFDIGGNQTLLTAQHELVSKKRKEAPKEDDAEEADEEMTPEQELVASSSTAAKRTIPSQHKVRTSLQDRTLDSMFPVNNPNQVGSKRKGKAREDAIDVDVDPPTSSQSQGKSREEIKQSECFLTSVKNLRAAVEKGKHRNLTQILSEHTFVGIVDLERSLSLIQHSTKLYLVNHATFAEELFYQIALRQFGDMPKIKLQPAPSLKRLVEIAVEAEDIPPDRDGKVSLSKPEIVKRIIDILMNRRDMLLEYFSLNISATGHVESIPMLLRGYTPNLDKLPCFLMRLGPQVDWTSEVECFDTFLRELAYFYVPGPLTVSSPIDSEDKALREQEIKSERWQVHHVLFPAFRRYLCAPKSLLDGTSIVQVANLPDLYKVFERC